METKTIRIRMEDYKLCRKVFPSYKGETAQSWFFRLTKFLKDIKR